MLFQNARLIDPLSGHDDLGDLRVRGQDIVETGTALLPADDEQVIDCAGKILAPSLIDLRCTASLSSTGLSGLVSTAKAGAAGGFGTLIISPDSGLDRPEAFAALEAASIETPVKLLPSGRLIDEVDELGEIGLMLRSGAAFVGDGGRAVADSRLLRRALSYAATFDTWTSVRVDDPFLSQDSCSHESDLALRLGFSARPALAERMAIERACALAELTGAKLILDRVTTEHGLDALADARMRGLDLAASVPITHLIFNEVDTASFDARYRLDPPLRSEEDRLALIRAIAQGEIDLLISDHLACTGESKAHPFPEAAPGSANLEAVLPALCQLVANRELSWIEALRPLTSNPAQLLDLDQGQLTPGSPADLVLFDPDKPIVHRADSLECSAPSAFENRRLCGEVLITLSNGAIVYQLFG